jgi:hypothetical protein
MSSRVAPAVGAVVRQVRSAFGSSSPPAGAGRPASGWLAVTVLVDPSDVDEAALPDPLAEMGERIDVRVARAPAERGTEIYARLRDAPSREGAAHRLGANDAEAELRSALRRAKQLLEVGEVLAVDPAPHGERPSTPGGALLESWTNGAPGAGVR